MNFPSRPWASVFLMVGAVAGCAVVTSKRLNDDTFDIRCQTPLARCLLEAETLCLRMPYLVLRAVDERNRVGANPQTIVLPSSRAVIRCGGTFGWRAEVAELMEGEIPDRDKAAPSRPPPAARPKTVVLPPEVPFDASHSGLDAGPADAGDR